MGTSDFHFGRQDERFNGLFRPTVPLAKREKTSMAYEGEES